MASTPLARTQELGEFVGTVAEVRDSIGMLSVTVGIEPGAGKGRTPPWQIAVENVGAA